MVDEQAWKALDMAREEEKTIFKRSSLAGPSELGPLEIDYSKIHHRAKDRIHLVEALDAAFLSLECTIKEHTDTKRDANLYGRLSTTNCAIEGRRFARLGCDCRALTKG
ncbi:hypothetical protein F4820DRAFT_183960 [Hypoxylon rubiginosum]|uniref:Uncharacterized protein n=1 Tax=Hypoxylon rubiginosum TaxID=110542 RepID=A0ACB9YI89_9PEZI|nr:hypothetical protein F4820DRAFT_183960 [Hypoxylon rubiginosum]